MSITCPQCGLYSPDGSMRCDCGFRFVAASSGTDRIVNGIVIEENALSQHSRAVAQSRNRPRKSMPLKIAAAYWMVVLVAFLLFQSAGFDMIGTGAIPIAMITAPWSALAIAVFSRASNIGFGPATGITQRLISTPGTFLILVVICGGLNALLIFAVGSAIQRRRAASEPTRIRNSRISRR